MIPLLTILAAIWGAIMAGSGQAIQATDWSPAALDQALTQIDSGTLVLSYPTREGVRGNGQGVEISLGQGSHRTFFNGHWDEENHLSPGPATVVITVRHGLIQDLDVFVGGTRETSEKELDLGTINPGQAANFFLNQATNLDSDLADDALLAAVIAQVNNIAPSLLNILENRSNQNELRQDTLMWLAVLASEKALEPLRNVIEEEDEDLEMREHAVFALAQLDRTDTLPMLLKIARNQDEPYLQRAAFFALAEHDTPEVRQLFEEILLTN